MTGLAHSGELQQQRPVATPHSETDKARAYAAGRVALKARRISRPAHELYEIYVLRTGDNPYCWPGVDVLREEMDCSDRQISRYNRELLKAGLIERERQMGRKWHTYVVAFKPDATAPVYLPDSVNFGGCDPTKNGGCDPTKNGDSDPPKMADLKLKEKKKKTNHPKEDHPNHPRATAVAGEGANAPTGESEKEQPRSVDGATPSPHSAAPSPVRLPTLEQRPVYEHLLAARHPKTGAPIAQAMKVLDGLAATGRLDMAYVERLLRYCGEHGRDWGLLVKLAGDPGFELAAPNGHYDELPHEAYAAQTQQQPTPEHLAAAHDAPEDSSQWQAVQALLKAEAEYVVWIAPLRLLAIDGERALIGAPDVISRDAVRGEYADKIAAALAQVLGQAVQVDVVIGG